MPILDLSRQLIDVRRQSPFQRVLAARSQCRRTKSEFLNKHVAGMNDCRDCSLSDLVNQSSNLHAYTTYEQNIRYVQSDHRVKQRGKKLSSAVAERPRDVRVIEHFAKSLEVIRNDTLE